MDYYQVLGVDRSATVDEVKTAYKQLAIRWHPDKNLNNVQEAGEKFKEIHEAYKVLIDTQKRANFDNKKKQRSNGGVPSPSSFPTEEYNESPSYQYTSFSDSIFNKFFGRGPALKDPPIEYLVHCTLEDLYVGTIKTIILTRDILSSRGQTKVVKEKLTINIMPGTKNGAKFIFEEKGSEKPNCIPADIIVIVHQKPHDLFSREGNDLILKETISLFGIFTCSCSVDFKTLDGRNLTVPINCVSFPFHEKVVRGEGMPLTGDPSKRGDLKIILNVRLF